MTNPTKRALDDLVVLDLSRVLAGPWCAQLMSDFGAEVIKIERTGVGDDSRGWGPPFVNLSAQERVATYFCSANRGKKSIALDIAKAEDRAEILKLVETADVFVENFKAGSLARFGLDFESLSKLNPRLVYCSITGYGSTGPYADRPGYDGVIQGVGGIMSVTGEKDGLPGAGPQRVGVALTDVMTGVYAAFGIMTALWERQRNGVGQKIELSLLDVQVTSMATLAASYFASGVVPTRQGNAHPTIVPSDIFPCKDGAILITVGNDSQFKSLCHAVGLSEFADDVRYATNEARAVNRESLTLALRQWFSDKGRVALTETLSKAGVPAGLLNDLGQVMEDPQVQHSDLVVKFAMGEAKPIQVLGNPLKLSRTPAQYLTPPPKLGEHTEQVLKRSREKS
jgi:crotonobetainyl-CoA:carnitine CoA-transferase CaiB-like acyl-CoA transferase